VAEVALDGVAKVYPDGTEAVRDLDLTIDDGEFMVFVGPSGCGKTTALRMVAGLEDISRGTIEIGDRVVNDVPSKDRDVAMVFQNYALYPHLTVYENMAFGLRLRKTEKSVIDARVREAAAVLGLTEFLDRKPRALSGGQRQRVAMGRAIVREPLVFLMDEPLSNLDAKLRVQMRAEIHRLQRRLGVTTLYVTHDQVEAMTMGDRVAVMRDGHLQQVDAPQVLYDSPVNEFVAGFIGSPSINLVEADLGRDDGRLSVTFGEHRLPVDDQLARNRSGLEGYVGKTIVLGIRPESFEDASLVSDVPTDRRVKTTADLIEPLGSEVLVYFTASATQFISSAAAENAADAEVRLGAEEDEGARARLVARLDPHTRVAVGNEIELTVDTSKLYFFDPETRAAI
jgi:multiple sugar transport system ATP-binding protein